MGTRILRSAAGSARMAAMAIMLATAMAGGAAAQLADKKALTLAGARRIAAAAEAEAVRNNLAYCIAIFDDGGNLLYLERMDGSQLACVRVSQAKGRAALLFKRSTKVFEDQVAAGRAVILGLEGAVPLEGGLPLAVDGMIVGAIGTSGGTPPQDGQIAAAGAAVLK